MDQQTHKEVHYHKYCKTCKHKETKETEAPCDECLGEPLNQNSHKPVRYEKKENSMNGQNRTGKR